MTKSAWVLVGTIAAVTTLEASKNRNICTISGTVKPAMGLRKLWLLQDNDTLAIYQKAGSFEVNVKPGNYRIWVDAVAPYRDLKIDSITLDEQGVRKLGELRLYN